MPCKGHHILCNNHQGQDFRALVFEFMPKGSLDSWIHLYTESQSGNGALTLEQRLYITIDIAEAIDYLHNGCQTSIIHCDLKPNNILLTQYMRACVAQQHSSYSGHEGLCCRSQDSKWSCKKNFLNSNTIGIRGSIGYFAPGNFNMLLSALHY